MACREALAKLCRTASAVPRGRRCSSAATTAGCPFHRRVVSSKDRPLQKANGTPATTVKPFDSIPTPKGLPLVGTMFDIISGGGPSKIHEYCDRRHQQLGPIFREKLGTTDSVVVSKKEYIHRIYYNEGRYPQHLIPEAWKIYNDVKGIQRGLFFMEGEQWLSRRQILNRVLIAPQAVASFGCTFNSIVSDLMERWRKLAADSNDGVVNNLESELYNWSIESLGTMLFGRRLGCVPPPQYTSGMHEFVGYVQQIFLESAKLSVISPELAYKLRLPVWKRFEKAADSALRMARDYTEQRISEIHELKEMGQEVNGVLNQLLQHPEISHDEIVNIIADLILAAADTTSHATQWALYLLARNPECQQKLLSQIREVVDPNETITQQHLEKIPYAMWIIKETLRLYPIASFLTRILPSKIILGDYEVPPGKLFIMSQYTVGRDPEQFPNPKQFVPERWQRSSTERMSHSCMPFGSGARSCIGRRVAELKMRLLITRIVQNFQLESANEKEVGIALRLITTPDQPIKIRLHSRST